MSKWGKEELWRRQGYGGKVCRQTKVWCTCIYMFSHDPFLSGLFEWLLYLLLSGMWKFRCLVTNMGTQCTCLRETAVCRGDIRKSLRKHLLYGEHVAMHSTHTHAHAHTHTHTHTIAWPSSRSSGADLCSCCSSSWGSWVRGGWYCGVHHGCKPKVLFHGDEHKVAGKGIRRLVRVDEFMNPVLQYCNFRWSIQLLRWLQGLT